MKELREVHITKIRIGEITLIFGQVQGRPTWRRYGQNFGGGVELPEEFMLGVSEILCVRRFSELSVV